MTMALNVALSSTDVLLILFFLVLVSGIVYVFYPALSIAKSPSLATDKVVSRLSKNGACEAQWNAVVL